MSVPPGGVPAASQGESASFPFQEKIRVVMYYLGGNAFVTRQQFSHLFGSLKVDFTEATVDDLFTKLQKFGDNRVEGLTHADVQRMVAVYPVLFNVLACRALDKEMDERQKEAIRRESVIQNELDDTKKQLEAALSEDEAELTTLADDRQKFETKTNELVKGGEDKRVELIGAHSDTKTAKNLLRGAMENFTNADKEHRRHCESLGLPVLQDKINEREAERDEVVEEITGIEQDIAGLEEQIRALCGKMADAKANLAEKDRAVAEAVDVHKEKSLQLHEPSSMLENATDEVDVRKKNLDDAQKKEQDTADALKNIIQEKDTTENSLNAIRQGLGAAELQAAQKRDEVEAAKSALNDQSKRVEEMRNANDGFNSLREEQYASEFTVVCQEIRLREQRESLEVKEAILRSEAERLVPHATSPPRTPHTPGTVPPTYSTPVHHNGISFTPPDHSPGKPTPLPGRSTPRTPITSHSGRL